MLEKRYSIYRNYENPNRRRRRMRRDLTLKQAQEHCNDPETSSMTAKTACNGNEAAIQRWHDKNKHWFDGYEEQ